MNLEKKISIAECIFNMVRDIPGLTEENIHEVLSADVKYKTASAKSMLYRMVRAKYIRKDKNGRLHAHIEAYKPLPPYKAKKKKPAPPQYREPKPVTEGFLGNLGRRISAYFR